MANYTNFCVRNGGSNLNSGTRNGDTTEPGIAALFTYASGSWVNATSIFTVASGNPLTDGIVVGDFFSIYADGATILAALFRVIARDATTITGLLVAGTSPADGTNNRTIKIGGAWAPPTGATIGPITLILGTSTNVAGDLPRINFKNDATYSPTAAITLSLAGPVVYQGYNASYGDGGIVTVSGATTGASYVPITLSGADLNLLDVIVTNNGATSTTNGVLVTGARCRVLNVVAHDIRGFGISCSNGTCIIENSETYACNQSGTINQGGFNASAGVFKRCISRDNVAANSVGFYNAGSSHAQFVGCISTRNAAGGLKLGPTSVGSYLDKCDFYDNTGPGIDVAITGTSAALTIENSNFLKNSTYAIGLSGSLAKIRLRLRNCGFGRGTKVNTSGDIQNTLTHVTEEGNIAYANDVTPWNAPDTNDFRIKLAASIGTGYGNYIAGNSTVSYPDVGSCESSKPTIPTVDKVLLTEPYGYTLNQLIGTVRNATVDKVLLAYPYGPSDTLIGTRRDAPVAKVEDGFLYGPSDTFEGELVASSGGYSRKILFLSDEYTMQIPSVHGDTVVADAQLVPKSNWRLGTVLKVPAGVTTISIYGTHDADVAATLLHRLNADGTYSPLTFTVEAGKSYDLPVEIASVAYLKFVTNIDCTLQLSVV